MKNKLLYICILTTFSIGFFSIGWYVNQSNQILGMDVSETARLRIDREELKILTNTYSTNRNFVFLDKIGTVAGTLSVENGWGGSPDYRIIRGHAHDWLVVTRTESSGTGLISHSDEWYILGWSYEAKRVLSYESDANEVPNIEGVKNKYRRTEVMNENYSDDSAMDIKLTEKSCTSTEDGSEKDCSESSHITSYIWSDDTEEFILKN